METEAAAPEVLPPAGPPAPTQAMAGAEMARRPAPGSVESARKTGHWIECHFVDTAGLPLVGVPYRLTLPAGEILEGVLCKDGAVRRDVPGAGRFEVALLDARGAEWGANMAGVEEPVAMSAIVSGLSDGVPATFVIFRRRPREADDVVATVDAVVRDGRVNAAWSAGASFAPTTDPAPDAPAGGTIDFYFEVSAGDAWARSGPLQIRGDLVIEAAEDVGGPVPNASYVVLLPDGRARRGRLDAAGHATVRDVPAGRARLHLFGN